VARIRERLVNVMDNPFLRRSTRPPSYPDGIAGDYVGFSVHYQRRGDAGFQNKTAGRLGPAVCLNDFFSA
jgi:hypothetical protein